MWRQSLTKTFTAASGTARRTAPATKHLHTPGGTPSQPFHLKPGLFRHTPPPSAPQTWGRRNMVMQSQNGVAAAPTKQEQLQGIINSIAEKIETLREGKTVGTPLVIQVPPAQLTDQDNQALDTYLGKALELVGLALQKKGSIDDQLSRAAQLKSEVEALYDQHQQGGLLDNSTPPTP